MWQRWFTDHPHAAGEGYFEHQRAALRFARKLLWAAFACFIHALVPGLFERSASRCVAQLHGEMMQRTARKQSASAEQNFRRYPAFF
jgi:uncharacterized protein DUF6356